MKKILIIVIAMTFAVVLVACQKDVEPIISEAPSATPEELTNPSDIENKDDINQRHIPNWSDTDLANLMDEDATTVSFKDDDILISGTGVLIEEGQVKITEAGNYVLSGKTNKSNIIVTVGDTDIVRLILNGLEIASETTAPLFIENAEKVIITIMADTENIFIDADKYIYEDKKDTEPNACIFSNDDITINGNGILKVVGNYNNGIASDNDLKIISGRITVTAENNGLKGNDSISIRDGIIDVTANGDGLKVKNNKEIDEGYIYIEGGQIEIVSGDDALQAVTSIMIVDGKISAASGGKTLNCEGSLNIAAGTLK